MTMVKMHIIFMLMLHIFFISRHLLMWVVWFQGYGVFATKNFEVGDFLLEYSGELVDPSHEDGDQTYHYYFTLLLQKYW